MKAKSKKAGAIGIAIVVICLAVMIVADVLVGTFYSMIMLFFRGETNTAVEMTEEEALSAAQEFTQKVEEEGLVLLKNDGILPLSVTENKKVNLFGNTSYQNLYQGTGSASSWFKQDINVNLKEGIENAGFEVNPGLWQFYEDNLQEREDQEGGVTDMSGADASILEQTMSQYRSYTYEGQNILEYSEEYSDTAILVFGRAGGEGSDAKLDMTGVTGGDAGKHYLELQQVEIDLLDYVTQTYENVIVLLNTPTPMEIGFVDSDEIDACIWFGMPGSTGNNAVGEVLAGNVTPSGHLADTWAYDLTSNPTYYNFGDYTYSNFTDPLGQDRNKYVYYNDGIYVGYRYYETAAAEEFINFEEVVQYPFGFGLSYTQFAWSDPQWSVEGKGGKITVSVTVTNTGEYSGKDVVQLYYHAPYYEEEGIEKSEVVLGGFAKTKLLAPGESDTVTITMDFDDMSSYDYKTERAYVLSAGEYQLSLRTDSHTVKAEDMTYSFDVDDKIVYNEENGARSSDAQAATNLYDDVSAGDGSFGKIAPLLTRVDFAGTFPTGRDQCADAEASDEAIALMTNSYAGSSIDIDNLDADHPEAEMPVTGADNGLTIADMIGLEYDDPLWDELLDQLTLGELKTLFGNCGWHNPAVVSIEKAMAVDMDGAEGLHNLTTDKTGNQYASTVVLASTWNVELAEEFGDVYADECLVAGVSGLYAPSMNTHRSPFGGRAFEYYSEDGLLSGKLAAAQINALWDKGITVYIKHYFMNDQETNRQNTVHTWATEQAMREIYAKGFQICVEEGNAHGIMSSMSRIGWRCAPLDYSSMTALLRGEWGYHGTVITDAQSLAPGEAEQALAAGCDMVCRTSATQYLDSTLESAGGQYMLREAAKNILYVTVNSIAISSDFNAGFPIYKLLLIAVWVVVALYLAYGTGEILLKLYPEQTVVSKKCKWIVRGVLWAVAAGILVTLAVMFFTTWLPALEFAFQTV